MFNKIFIAFSDTGEECIIKNIIKHIKIIYKKDKI